MASRIIGTLAIAIYTLVVPLLEINATHLFNPEWVPHARTHEAWQLITNSSFGLLALWLIWKQDKAKLAGMITIVVMGGFLAAFALQDSYGGSMVVSSDHHENKIFGVNLGGFGAALSVLLAASSMILSNRRLAFPTGTSNANA